MTIRPVEAGKPADLLKSSATLVWLLLIVATILSWALGTHHGFVDDDNLASVVILVIAFIKVRFIGLYFMELKDAPVILRTLIEAYCLVVCGITVGIYLAG